MYERACAEDVSYFSNKIKIFKQKSEHNMDGKVKLSYCSFIVSVNMHSNRFSQAHFCLYGEYVTVF